MGERVNAAPESRTALAPDRAAALAAAVRALVAADHHAADPDAADPDTADPDAADPDADATGPLGGAAIDELRALEELKSACAARQARVTARFAADQRAEQRAGGVRPADVGKGIAAQVALARRDSPARGSRHLGLAEALVREMPCTLAALEAGEISEWRATLVVRETACLSREDRGRVDAELAARPGGLEALGDAAAAAEARRIGYRLDPHAVTDRARRAETERRVTLRPAPDTMSVLSGLLPAAQGVAAWTALGRAADAARASGDTRSRGQVMADTLVERVTGQARADAVPVEVHMQLSDASLFGAGDEPAELAGYGPVPAPYARAWLRGPDARTADDTGHETGPETGHQDGATSTRAWLRRLYTRSADGALVAMDSRRRLFPVSVRRFLIARDRRCRTPWCDAPIRHADHAVPASAHGRTSIDNGQGLCEACNYAKQAPGWHTRVLGDQTVQTTTPTGRRYVSRPPPTLGNSPPGRQVGESGAAADSGFEVAFRDLVLAC